MSQHAEETSSGARFEFGENWARFLVHLTTQRIDEAQASLRRLLGTRPLEGLRFLDAGSGSGLFSLAANQMGATVVSFDYDPRSVACTNELKLRHGTGKEAWRVEEGSVLDAAYLATLGKFDVVYSWGVLHHTGNMALALRNVAACVAPTGRLVIAIYNDQGWVSKYWHFIKRRYNSSSWLRPVVIALHAPYLVGVRFVVRALTGRLALERGMSLWHDCIDWLGGYPFEVAKPEEMVTLFRDLGFVLENMSTCGGRHGCNEFVFRKTTAAGVDGVAPGVSTVTQA